MMWLARDEDGCLYLWEDKPHRGNGEWLNSKSRCSMIRFDIFPEIVWGSKPLEVQLVPVEGGGEE